MSKSHLDPVFGGRVASLRQSVRYHVEFGDRQSKSFRATVFEYPRLVRADANLTFPSYTGKQPKVIQDVRRVTAVEGSQLTLSLHLNKPCEAELTSEDDSKVSLAQIDQDGAFVYEASWVLKQSQRLTLHLKDDKGRENRSPPEFVITVVKNKPPKLKLWTLFRSLTPHHCKS